jgi:beta-lactamase superfamily II metal-dependent hydrolase
MKKQIIFNVGGGLSSYIEIDEKKILVDIGNSSDFSPIDNFLIPLFKKRKESKNGNEKYLISQLVMSHPHNDHISNIQEFHKEFYADLITTPNDNDGMPNAEKINWSLVDNPTDKYVKYLRYTVLPGRKPPLKSFDEDYLKIFYLKSLQCEKSPYLEKKNYTNNLSISVFLFINGSRILMPGDLMKDGFTYLIEHNQAFKNELESGVDYLIAPHHGLKSSFSTDLFTTMKNSKTKRLNIISEGPSSEDSDREIDSRYSSTDYCEGKNNLSTSETIACQRKTSNGHVIIDYSTTDTVVSIESSNDESTLINYFL